MSEVHPDTLLVVGGGPAPEPWPDGMSSPIFPSVTYDLHERAYADIERTGGEETWWYTRLRNPTIEATAAKLAALEHADGAIVFSSGMAAIATTLLALVGAGGRVVASRDLYGDVFTLLAAELPRHGRSASFVAVDDIDGWERELAAGADLLYVETLSNPMLRVADLPRLASLAHRAGAIAVADATFTPPTELRALDHGFDVVVHSATKYLTGHHDALLGATVTRDPAIRDRLYEARMRLGLSAAPDAAAMLLRGVQTLDVRVRRQSESAAQLARRLAEHPAVLRVRYPGIGGLIAFDVADDAPRRVETSTTLIANMTSLGGVRSTMESRHRWEGDRIPKGLLRLSVGLEDVDALWADLSAALANA
jgi:cystathionine gamma-synthase